MKLTGFALTSLDNLPHDSIYRVRPSLSPVPDGDNTQLRSNNMLLSPVYV